MTETSFDQTGFKLIQNFLSIGEIDALSSTIESHAMNNAKGGIRNAEKVFPAVNKLATSDKLIQAARPYLTGRPNFVRAILFDKSPTNNWLVSWHQDKTVAISEKMEKEGWGPWTVKDSVNHVQPPLQVLDDMVTFRLHLDDTTKENGCLRVLSGSHRHGILAASDVASYTKTQVAVNCEARAGDALVMRPHLLHASRKAANPKRRRVLHIEYSGYQLPNGLSWV